MGVKMLVASNLYLAKIYSPVSFFTSPIKWAFQFYILVLRGDYTKFMESSLTGAVFAFRVHILFSTFILKKYNVNELAALILRKVHKNIIKNS